MYLFNKGLAKLFISQSVLVNQLVWQDRGTEPDSFLMDIVIVMCFCNGNSNTCLVHGLQAIIDSLTLALSGDIWQDMNFIFWSIIWNMKLNDTTHYITRLVHSSSEMRSEVLLMSALLCHKDTVEDKKCP